jgi:hypothetical protein
VEVAMTKPEKDTHDPRRTATAIDREIEEISGKILAGESSTDLRAKFERLQAQRREELLSISRRNSNLALRLRRSIKAGAL